MRLRIALLLAAATLPTMLIALGGAPLRAQLSPNCQRNGIAAACAVMPGESGVERSVVTVMAADHSAWRLEKDESRCTYRHPVSSCPALFRGANGNGTPRSGSDTGTWFEGGYRHSWSAPGIRIGYAGAD